MGGCQSNQGLQQQAVSRRIVEMTKRGLGRRARSLGVWGGLPGFKLGFLGVEFFALGFSGLRF